ncbi:hypothetical protein C8Q73DRAFT_685040 [Cubamyces lactineus]|nr:hypothetical protein C8Q73DRAFT_685040 [Cubamyces lactineus]
MVLSANNRKSFPLNLSIPNLSKTSFSDLSLSKDAATPQSDRSLRSSFAPSPSRVSFLSPRSPHVPASLHLKQEQPVIPIPLTDGLDPSEKMKLLRKSRKLSRILGEVPIPVSIDSPAQTRELRFLHAFEEPSLTSASTSASSSPAKTPPVIDERNSLKRSATVGHSRHAEQNKIQRAHSLASLRPSLTIPPAAVTIHPAPISPIVFSWPDKSPIAPSPLTPITPSDDGRRGSMQSKRDSTVSSRRDSVASSIFPHERSPEQVQRARAAKLARQLGDVPPDVLIRASSPQPRPPFSSPSMVSFAEASLTIRDPPRRTSSARPSAGKHDRRDARRRLSLDLRTFVRVPEPPIPSPSLSDADKHGSGLPKSNSILAARKGSAPPPATRPYDTDWEESSLHMGALAAERDSDLDSDVEDGFGARPLSLEQQRALNVRRARKMLQMFGNEPPPSLFQITNIPPRATDEGISVALSIAHRRRDSQATAVSIPASEPPVAEETHESNRDSVATASSSGDNLSPLIFADPSQPPTPHPGLAEQDSEAPPALPPLPPSQDTVVEVRPSSPLSIPTIASSSLHSLSLASAPASRAQSVCLPSPQTSPIRPSFQASPPAQATMFLFGPASAPTSPPLSPTAALPEPAAEIHPSDPNFRMRRLRAAKLSRFFGVGLNDIAGMIRGGGTSSSAGVPPAPPSPPLREFRRSDASESIPSSTSVRSSRSIRPTTSAGIIAIQTVSVADPPCPRERTMSSGARSRSVSGAMRRPQTQPTSQPVGERYRSNSQPEALLQQAAHSRAYSTTVEVSAETKGPFAFLEGRRPSKAKEMHMHDVIRELRKIK